MKPRAYNAKAERNRAIFTLYESGKWTLTQIGLLCCITPTRVWGILHSDDWRDLRG
jgi:hypothetical protein